MADEHHTTTNENDDSKESVVIPIESLDSATPVITGVRIPQTEVPQPIAPSTVVPDNETEFERIERLKINTDDAPHSGVINDDIAKILKEVKLPERRDMGVRADTIKPLRTPPPPTPSKEAAPTPEEKKEHDIVTALHTLKDDLQDIVRNRKISLVRASALEQDKQRGEAPRSMRTAGGAQRSRRTFAFIFAALLLIALGVAALYGVAVVMENRSATPATPYPSILFAEQTVTVPLDATTPSSLKATIVQARNQSSAPLGSIMRIVPTIATTDTPHPTTQQATVSQFLTALGAHPPDKLLRGLGDTFFFGIHTVDINGPVLVIPVASYDLAFAGMLAWEPAMNQELAPSFDAVPALIIGADGLPRTRTFTDTIMLNYDVRALKDDEGTIVLYYSFPTPNILVIAESPHTFTEILSRLQAQRRL